MGGDPMMGAFTGALSAGIFNAAGGVISSMNLLSAVEAGNASAIAEDSAIHFIAGAASGAINAAATGGHIGLNALIGGGIAAGVALIGCLNQPTNSSTTDSTTNPDYKTSMNQVNSDTQLTSNDQDCWKYSQSSGQMNYTDPKTGQSTVVGEGYAGNGEGYNNSDYQYVKDTGPLPQGKYTIGPYSNDYVNAREYT